MERIKLQGMRFVNESGQEVILHGVNVLCRDAKLGHIYPGLEEGFAYFRRMGFNLIRYGIFWDAVEPAPGKIDDEYLRKVKDIVRMAEESGVYVMIDMHQDLFAQKFIDGAPDWACLDEGLPHPSDCNLWYEAYLKSDAIIRAADNFWANKPASDGVGLLDHYEKMWEEIAKVLSDCPNVIGLEPMNEPFMGSIARNAFGLGTMKMMEKNPFFDLARPDLIPPEQAAEFMQIVASQLLDFDRTTLMDFYRRMQRAIQKTSDLPIITGGNIYCSTDVPTGIERLEGTMQIYGPHGYDSVVDSDRYESFSRENVECLYAGKRESQLKLQLPTIAAEWGAFPSKDFTGDLIRHMNGIIEKYLWGSAYCEYRPGMEKDEHFSALRRAYPQETGGKIVSYHYDPEAQSFTMCYEAEPGKETVIFLPFVPEKCDCSGKASVHSMPLDDQCTRIIVTAEEAGEMTISMSGTGSK